MNYEDAERGVPLRDRLAEAGIDPMDYADTVQMDIKTVLYADVSAETWKELLAEYLEKKAERDG